VGTNKHKLQVAAF